MKSTQPVAKINPDILLQQAVGAMGAVESPSALPAPHVVRLNVEALGLGELIADFLDVHSQLRPDSYLDAGHHDAAPAEQGLPRIGNLLPLTLPSAVPPEGGAKAPVAQTTYSTSIESYLQDASGKTISSRLASD